MEKCRQESSCWKRLQTTESTTEIFSKHTLADDLLQTPGHLHMGSLQCVLCESTPTLKQILGWEGLCETIRLGLAALMQQNLLLEE